MGNQVGLLSRSFILFVCTSNTRLLLATSFYLGIDLARQNMTSDNRTYMIYTSNCFAIPVISNDMMMPLSKLTPLMAMRWAEVKCLYTGFVWFQVPNLNQWLNAQLYPNWVPTSVPRTYHDLRSNLVTHHQDQTIVFCSFSAFLLAFSSCRQVIWYHAKKVTALSPTATTANTQKNLETTGFPSWAFQSNKSIENMAYSILAEVRTLVISGFA